MNFVAFDFETANNFRSSACSIALTVVKKNQIVAEFYSLINPKTEFLDVNIKIHGITPKHVENAPTFKEIWPHINRIFSKNNLVVAHNATFDCSVLSKSLDKFNLPKSNLITLDTLKTSRYFFPNFPNHKLNTVAEFLNINLLNHHNALEDSRACANILIHQIKKFGTNAIEPFILEKQF